LAREGVLSGRTVGSLSISFGGFRVPLSRSDSALVLENWGVYDNLSFVQSLDATVAIANHVVS